jgi:hypothetical protein
VQLGVCGPDSGSPSAGDLRRLFRGQRMTAARRARLEGGTRILVTCGSRLVGLAAYQRTDREIRVYEVGVDPASGCSSELIEASLLDALELACLASGARRLLVLPRATSATDRLTQHGFRPVAAGYSGTWFEKTFA